MAETAQFYQLTELRCHVLGVDAFEPCFNNYSITPEHFFFCSSPPFSLPNHPNNFLLCAQDPACAEQCVRNYLFEQVFGLCTSVMSTAQASQLIFDDFSRSWFGKDALCSTGSTGAPADVCNLLDVRLRFRDCFFNLPPTVPVLPAFCPV